MQRISLVNIAHDLIREVLRPGDIAIDATIGNGHDTVFLVEQVGSSGRVFGFDIQQSAIDSTRAKVESCCNMPLLTKRLALIHASHANMGEKIPAKFHGNISAIMFNLGYRPGGDKSIITQTDSTLQALNSASQLLATKGLITIMAYPGHAGGDKETPGVKSWCEQLNPNQFSVNTLYSIEDKESAPRLFVVSKMR